MEDGRRGRCGRVVGVVGVGRVGRVDTMVGVHGRLVGWRLVGRCCSPSALDAWRVGGFC